MPAAALRPLPPGPTAGPRRLSVVVPYDRSGDSEAAVDRAVALFPDAELTVLAVWRPLADELHPSVSGQMAADVGADGSDADRRDAALTLASIGARHAADAGVRARPRSQVAATGVSAAVVAVAEELDADVIVIGRHGRSGERYAELGETVLGVLEHTGRTVVVASGRDVPHDGAARSGTPGAGHGGVRVGAWVPRTTEDEQEGTR